LTLIQILTDRALGGAADLTSRNDEIGDGSSLVWMTQGPLWGDMEGAVHL
jgi:hypothetical protein